MAKSMQGRWLKPVLGSGAILGACFGLTSVVPLDHEAIQYAKGPVIDPVSSLQKDVNTKKTRLKHDPSHGYLPAVLEALKVPRESQMLVFSKTSFQASRITPVAPRAIYFNDQVTVGYVPGGDVVEIAAQDPKQGVIFYTLDQDPSTPVSFVRRDDACLQCHLNSATLDVPGLLIRSVYTEPSGMPLFQAGGFVTDHRSPLRERWGGWYVTGQHGPQMHMGNAFVRNREKPDQIDTAEAFNRDELPSRVRRELYLTPHSDIVALMVAEHQLRAMNLMTRLNFETRLALHQRDLMSKLLGSPSAESAASARRRIARYADELAEYMLFLDEAPLVEPIRGTSGFSEAFEKVGPADSRGRSLRQLDLKRRLFRYPLSYTVYLPAFDNLPQEALDYVSKRLGEVLTGVNAGGKFARLSMEDRQAVLEILRTTKPNFSFSR